MNNEVTVVILNEIQCQLYGLNCEDLDTLYQAYGLHVQDHIFMAKVKLGVWDGKKRLVSHSGITYNYLLTTIVKKITQMGYTLKLDDRRRQFKLPILKIDANVFAQYKNEYGDPFILRDYQESGINHILDNHGGIFIAGTGAGKTIISGSFTKAYGDCGLRVITIVPTASLVLQSSAAFNEWGLDCGCLDKDHKELDRTHLVTTWQSLKNVPTVLTTFDVIIVDECQAAKANVLSNLIQEYGKNSLVRIGLTGTMPEYDLDNLLVRIMLGDIQYEVPADKLIERKFLSTIDIEIVELEELVKSDYFPDFSAEMSFLRNNDQRKQWIRDFVIEKSQMENGNVLMLVTSKVFGRMLSKLIPNSHFVSGDDGVKNRKIIYDLFKTESHVIVIATAQVAGTGLSIDRVFNLIFVDLGKSFIRVIQAIGRGLRRNEKAGKEHCDVYDISSNLKYSKKHQRKRTQHYKKNNYPFSVTKQQYKQFDLDNIVD